MFPFSAIVGQEDAKLALMISSVDSSIGGVLLSGVKGTGKSTLVRAFANVLPEIDVSAGCPYHCDPKKPDSMCSQCKEKHRAGKIEVAKMKPRVVSVPLGTTEDRLLGTIDVQKILADGEVSFRQGLIAKANRQILYIDEVNLLPDNLTDDILDVAVSGVNRVEREGISIEHPARFVLVGTMNPEEGQLRPQILDRFAISVKIDTITDPDLRVEIINRALSYSLDSERFCRGFAKLDKKLAERIADARDNLHNIKISKKLINTVALAMSRLGVDGQRPDIVIVKSAIALASLWGDKKVELKHIKKVSPMAVCHRTRNGGFDEPPSAEDVSKYIDGAYKEISGSSDSAEFTLQQIQERVLESAINAILMTQNDSKKND